jgi:hypothetical protein
MRRLDPQRSLQIDRRSNPAPRPLAIDLGSARVRLNLFESTGTCAGRRQGNTIVFMRRLRLHSFAVALLLALVSVALLVTLAGCGSSSSPGSTADPAGVTPASAPLYAGAVVRPTGTLQTDANAAGTALTHQPHAFTRLVQILQVPGAPPLDYGNDIAPWLGPNAGIFLSSLSTSTADTAQLQQLLTKVLQSDSSTAGAWPFATAGAQGAIVLDTSDVSKAESFVKTEAQHAGAHAASYRGVSYQATSAGVALGIVDRLVVLGTVTGIHNVIDTSLGGPSLVHAASYSKLLASAPSETLAHVYSAPGASRSASATGGSGSASGSGASSALNGTSGSSTQDLNGLLGLLGGTHTLNVSAVPSASTIALDVDSLTPATTTGDSNGGLVASASEGAQALSELPGESWLAVGLGKVGATLAGDVKALHSLGSLLTSLGGSTAGSSAEEGAGGFNIKGVLEGVLAPLSALSAPGAQTQHDFLSWMSSAGLFASGTGIVNLRGGIVLGSKDPALSKAAVAKLGTALTKSGGSVQTISIPGTDAAISARVNGLPVELDIANGHASDGQTKFVIGLGEASVTDALNPPSTLSSASSTSVAATTLGEGIKPSVIVEFPTLLTLLEGVGLSEDPGIAKALPTLRSLTTLAGGGKSLGGGLERFRLVAGLQQAEQSSG